MSRGGGGRTRFLPADEPALEKRDGKQIMYTCTATAVGVYRNGAATILSPKQVCRGDCVDSFGMNSNTELDVRLADYFEKVCRLTEFCECSIFSLKLTKKFSKRLS